MASLGQGNNHHWTAFILFTTKVLQLLRCKEGTCSYALELFLTFLCCKINQGTEKYINPHNVTHFCKVNTLCNGCLGQGKDISDTQGRSFSWVPPLLCLPSPSLLLSARNTSAKAWGHLSSTHLPNRALKATLLWQAFPHGTMYQALEGCRSAYDQAHLLSHTDV
jgi:hypothetical protein